MKVVIKILKFVFVGIVVIYLTFIIGGLIVKSQGQSEINQASEIRDNAKIATDKNGRKIEYFLYGSANKNAPVIINMHGSGLDGTFEKAVHQKACEELGVRGIAISLPGVGNTDMKKGRRVVDWASEDLQAVLEAENVDTFMITGHSQGNPHAMAAAYHFKDRITGLGLNAPLLPNDVTDEIGIAGNTWESALDVAYLWGFDPREIDTKNICIWHASDDTACPPEIGAWLAKFYKEKGARVNFKNNDIGFNHMTFCSSYYREANHSMVKALLDGQKK